eukprot:2079527-Pyramimonas_sp.AAC.1
MSRVCTSAAPRMPRVRTLAARHCPTYAHRLTRVCPTCAHLLPAYALRVWHVLAWLDCERCAGDGFWLVGDMLTCRWRLGSP